MSQAAEAAEAAEAAAAVTSCCDGDESFNVSFYFILPFYSIAVFLTVPFTCSVSSDVWQ